MKAIFTGLIGFLALGVFSTHAASTRLDFASNGRFLMHGTPRFVLGVYDSGLGYSNDAAFYEKTIFASDSRRKLSELPLNLYLNYHYGEAPVRAMNALMDTLDLHGMMYLQTANCFNDGSYTRIPFNLNDAANVKEFAEHRAAAGYYIMDECQDSLAAETKAHHQNLQAADPDGKTFATLYSASFRDYSIWADAADILAVDPYPLYGKESAAGYAHFKVADEVARLRKAVPASRPVVAVLQLFKFTSDSRMPTYEEMRSHAVMSIVEGAQGIVWWELGQGGLSKSNLTAAQKSEGFENLKKLTHELNGLQPALVAESAGGALKKSTDTGDAVAYRKSILPHNTSVNPLFRDKTSYKDELAALEKGDTSKSYLLDQSGPIRTLAKVVNGKGYIFAYNYTNQPVSATFTWRNNLASVRENGSGAEISASGSVFSDTFGPYGARIYVLEEGRQVPVTPVLPNEPIQQLPTGPIIPVRPEEPVQQVPPGGNPVIRRPILANLFYGLRGENVKSLQRALIRFSFLGIGLDTGYFGPLTRSAVQRFQALYNLPSTGFFGPLSRAKAAILGWW